MVQINQIPESKYLVIGSSLRTKDAGLRNKISLVIEFRYIFVSDMVRMFSTPDEQIRIHGESQC